MAALRDIIDLLDATLDAHAFEDHGPNGLQVDGPAQIATVVTGVSAHAALFERAAELGADLVLVHHGLLWGAGPSRLDGLLHTRLKLLFAHDMALAAYHLPLDAHPQLGNNALLARALGARATGSFAEHGGRAIGVVAELDAPLTAAALDARVHEATGRAPLSLGPARTVSTVGIVTGAAAGDFPEAVALGVDAFVTGEPAERSLHEALETGVRFVAAGHHATETFGVRAAGDLLAARLGVSHHFADLPNPV